MKKISTLAIVCLLVLVAVPNLALASWWNPFTWFSHQTIKKPPTSDFRAKTAASNPELKADPAPKSNGTQNPPAKKKEVINKPSAIPPQTLPVVAAPVAEPVPVKVEPQDPSKIAMRQLLQNPTYENFRLFCDQAKSLQGYSPKKTLNSNRDQIVATTVSLYEDISGCKFLDKGQDFVVYNLPDSSLYLTLRDTDTDLVRETKITYNNKLDTYSQSAKFVIFPSPFDFSKNPPAGVDMRSVVSVSEYYLNQLSKLSATDPKQRSRIRLPQVSVAGALLEPISRIKNLYASQ